MLALTFACGPLQANCSILAQDDDSDCVIIDPGMDAAEAVKARLAHHRLTPTAILATHGHIDHIGDAAGLADYFDIDLHIHPADRHLLTDPGAGLSPDLAWWAHAAYPDGLREPRRVVDLTDMGQVISAGLELTVIHTPGHTPGSVVYQLDADRGQTSLFTGDLLFAGSIGRTDFPGGDPIAMTASLTRLQADVPHSARLIPGHGPASTMSNEIATNPYL
ncbi:MAG: MBL fold metallo-hydrolase [Propionibacteriaceae bacterium]|jgi:glyoxylase-like metal-dependent hydrolase (beta-lactamase superfamily II)|nr:MBL fold metallo-hydrolase [Propionibacteriaceae bacterium]